MAYDHIYSSSRSRWREEPRRWRDDNGRSGRHDEERGWGEELRGWFAGRRHDRENDDGSYEDYREREALSRDDWSNIRDGSVGYRGGFGEARFDRVGIGRTGPSAVDTLSSGSNYGFSPKYRNAACNQAIREHDPHYSEWRRRQIDTLDRDYDDYRQENQSRFNNEFGAWRKRRGEQRDAVGRVNEHMDVVGSDDSHVGTVDKVRGDSIVLTKNDAAAGGVHHRIPCGWVDRVDQKVRLNLTGEQVMERWQMEGRSRALFEPEDTGSDGPHILNRSFSGTYRDE